MRALLVFVASGLGVGAFWRRRRRQPQDALPYAAGSDDAGPDHAAELRAKLAESKAEGGEEPAQEAPSTVERSPLDPESRRKDLHDRARASIDELG